MKLNELKKLAEAATPGPWDYRCLNALDNMTKPRHLWSEYGWIGETIGMSSVADAQFIAASRTMVPRLIEALELAMQCTPLKIEIQIKKILNGVDETIKELGELKGGE